MADSLASLIMEISDCRACAEQFAATRTGHQPRPVVRASRTARVLIAGQAPGTRVHASGIPFDDPSGERLRGWMGIGRELFYDRSRIAIAPMAFCFPGLDARGSDLPPPPRCARLWRAQLLALMPQIELTIYIGSYAQKWALGAAYKSNLTETVRSWRDYAPAAFPTPHPSWRNTAWLKRNLWFEEEAVPWLRESVARLTS